MISEKDLEKLIASLNIRSAPTKKKRKRQIGFAYDNYMLLHQNSANHPERPSWLMSIYTHFEKRNLLDFLTPIKCKPVDPAILELVHSKEHISKIVKCSQTVKEEGSNTSKCIGSDVYCN